MVNYETDLQYLFQSTPAAGNNKKPYYIDNIFFSIISENSFKNNISKISQYFKDISTVDIAQEQGLQIRRYTNNALPGEVFETPEYYPIPDKQYSFQNDANSYDLNVSINYNTSLTENNFKSIINELTQNNTNYTVDITKNHKMFRDFLFDIMEDITRINFLTAKNKMQQLAKSSFTDSRTCVVDIIDIIGNLSTNRISNLMIQLRNTCINSFTQLFNDNKILNSDDISNLQIGGFTNRLYYNLRTMMISKFVVDNNIYYTSDDNQLMFFKKYIVDLYLKSCYPVVHLIFMQAMLNNKAKNGDYVNVRIIVLSMAYYVFYTLSELKILDTSITTPTNKMTIGQETLIKTFMQYILAYIENNTKPKIDAVNTNDELKKIIIELHDLSNQVVNTNNTIQSLQQQISDNQLNMRNILFNSEIKRRTYKYTYMEFVLSSILLLIFIVTCTVLLIFQQHNIVYSVCGVSSISIILYMTIMSIIKILKGNK